MKALILAAWQWTRLKPLTNTKPKPLIDIFWKTILEHSLDVIYKHVDEIIIVVKYKKELFREYFWDRYKWTKITYFEQWDKKWTGWALDWLKISNTDLRVMNWDSIFNESDLEKIIKMPWYWCLVKVVENPSIYWIFAEKSPWLAKSIIEKPVDYVWNLANLWVYRFNSEIINICEKLIPSIRWEYEITDAINEFISKNEFKLLPIDFEFIDVWYPWNILQANNSFLEKLSQSKIDWVVEENVIIKWNIILWKWSVLKSWTYIEWNVYIWENTSIWPHTYIRWNTVIWNDCKIGNAVEIKNSCIGKKSNVAHLSYLWDCVIWNNVNIWGGLITANLRHDKTNIKVMVQGKLVDSWMRKLWCIIWDNTKIWIKNSIYPWRIIENDSFTLPWDIIK